MTSGKVLRCRRSILKYYYVGARTCARQVICCWVAAGVVSGIVDHCVDPFVDRSVNHLYHSNSDITVVGILNIVGISRFSHLSRGW